MTFNTETKAAEPLEVEQVWRDAIKALFAQVLSFYKCTTDPGPGVQAADFCDVRGVHRLSVCVSGRRYGESPFGNETEAAEVAAQFGRALRGLPSRRPNFSFVVLELPHGCDMVIRVTDADSPLSLRAIRAYAIQTNDFPTQVDIGWREGSPA